MKFKRVLTFLVILSFTFVLVACGETTTEATTTAAPTTEATTTVATTTVESTTVVTTTEATTTTETTTAAQSQTLSILNGWVDSGDSVYTIVQSDTELGVTYDKNNFSWANMEYTIDQDLSAYNKLVLSISGSGTMLVKIQGATEAFEVSIQLTAGEVSYQLNLRDYDDFLGGVTGVMLFAGPGKVSDTGNFTITNFSFDEGTAYGTVLENGDNNIPQNEQEYDGTGDIFDFSAGFVDSGDGVYAIDKTGDNPIVTYTKAVGFEWAYMISTVKGDFSDFDYVVLTIKGITAGQVMLKAELSGSVQEEIAASFAIDEEITLCLDLSTWTDEQLDALTKILVFADPESALGAGEFEVTGAYFSKEFVGEVVVPNYGFLTGWTEGDAGTYTFTTTVEETTQVDYTKAVGQTWVLMSNIFDSELSAGFNTMTFTVKGTVDKTIMIKPNDDGALEQTITFTGEEQTFEITASSFSKMIIFAEPGTEDVTGSFEIVEAKLTYIEPTYEFLTGWTEGDAGTYTFTTTVDETTQVDYTKAVGQTWIYMINAFDSELSAGFNTMTFTVKGPVGKSILIKPNDDGALEQTITFTGEEQIVEIFAYSFTNMVIFAEPGTEDVTGSFEILGAKLTYVEQDPVDASVIYDVNTNWEDNEGGIYTFTTVDGITTVDYSKIAGQDWASIKNIFKDNLSNFDTIQITVKGTVGEQLIIKPNDNGAYEQTITFTGVEQTFTFTLSDIPQNIYIFVDPINGSLAGSFEIIRTVVYAANPDVINFTNDFVENDADTYEFEMQGDGSVLVTYTKAAGQEWIFMISEFVPEDVTGLNTMTLVLQGTDGKTIMIKPNNDGALEQTITFTGSEQTIVVSADTFTSLVIFAEPGTAEVIGTFKIISAELSYIEPSYEFLTGWVEGDAGTYTFTTTVDDTTQVDYIKGVGQTWIFMKNDFLSEDVDGFNTMTLVLIGTAGKTIMLKPNDSGALEQTITFTGDEQTIVVSASSFTTILMFVEPGTEDVSGSFEIVSALLTYVAPLAIDPWVEVVTDDSWIDNDGGIYTFTEAAGVVTVDYTRTSEQTWALIKYLFEDNLSNHDTLTIVVNGTVGEQLIIKPNDNGAFEQTITFDGTDQTFVFDMTETLESIIIFADPMIGSLTGSFDIVSAVVTSTKAELDFTNIWIENDADTYDFAVQVDDSVIVSYTKVTAQEWSFMVSEFIPEDVAGLNTLTLVVQGTLDKTMMIKPNDDGALEQIITFTGAEQTIVVTADSFSKMVIFAEQGITDVTGSFTILSATLTHVDS